MNNIDYGKIRSNAIESYGSMTTYLNGVLYLLNNMFMILHIHDPATASKYFLLNFTGQSTVIPDLELLIDLADTFARHQTHRMLRFTHEQQADASTSH